MLFPNYLHSAKIFITFLTESSHIKIIISYTVNIESTFNNIINKGADYFGG